MTSFHDGPAGGLTLSLQRSPVWLRVVVDPSGKVDALDLIDDIPGDSEKICVYRLIERRGGAFIDGRGPTGRRWGRYVEIADYRLYHDQPPDDRIRDNAAWQEWTLKTQATIDS